MGRGIAVLHGGPHRARGRGGFRGFLFPIFTMGNAIRSPTVKCFRFVYENLTKKFRSANVSLGSLICGLFGDIFGFKINVGVYEKLAKKVTSLLPKLRCTQPNVAARGALTAAAAADGQLAHS